LQAWRSCSSLVSARTLGRRTSASAGERCDHVSGPRCASLAMGDASLALESSKTNCFEGLHVACNARDCSTSLAIRQAEVPFARWLFRVRDTSERSRTCLEITSSSKTDCRFILVALQAIALQPEISSFQQGAILLAQFDQTSLGASVACTSSRRHVADCFTSGHIQPLLPDHASAARRVGVRCVMTVAGAHLLVSSQMVSCRSVRLLNPDMLYFMQRT
jgi:hypothetical protein